MKSSYYLPYDFIYAEKLSSKKQYLHYMLQKMLSRTENSTRIRSRYAF